MFSAANLSTASADTDHHVPGSPAFSSAPLVDPRKCLHQLSSATTSSITGKPPPSPYQCRKLRPTGRGKTEISMTAMALLSPSTHQDRLIVKPPKLKYLRQCSQQSSSFECSEDGYTSLLKDTSDTNSRDLAPASSREELDGAKQRNPNTAMISCSGNELLEETPPSIDVTHFSRNEKENENGKRVNIPVKRIKNNGNFSNTPSIVESEHFFIPEKVPDTSVDVSVNASSTSIHSDHVVECVSSDTAEDKPLSTTPEILKINISGGYFEVFTSTVERYPDTVLGNPDLRDRHYLQGRQEYFFERNRLIFSSILYFYQSNGKFYRPTCISEEQFLEEVKFFKLTEYYKQYIDDIDSTKRKKSNDNEDDKKFLDCLWDFFEDPASSSAARMWALLDVIAIVLAVAIFIIETIPSIKRDIESEDNNWKKLTFFIIETVCIIFFTVELIARLICSPSKLQFIKGPMNWVDFVTILPYYIQFLADNNEGQALVVLRVLRVIRVLKLARHSKGIMIVTKTLAASINELALLLFFWFIGVIIFGSIMYYLENSPTSSFTSILQSSWWAVVTMSTVGYGDMVPKTPVGRVVASVCMMFSMIVIALPVTVIVSKFTRVYAKYRDKL